MKYSECNEIKPYLCTAWLIVYDNDREELQLWHPNAKVEDVVRAIRHRYGSDYTVQSVDNGGFTVTRDDKLHSYAHDGRKVDQDMMVSV